MTKWACIACDQFTSEPEYWNRIEKKTENSLTTYELIFPECFLGQKDDERIEKINSKIGLVILHKVELCKASLV